MYVQRYEAIRNKTQEVLDLAKKLYGVDIKPSISFSLRGRVAGWAGCKLCRITMQRAYTLRFNCELIQGKHFEDIRDETVPHEIAHLICFARPELGAKHNDGWRRVCLALGGNGKSRHDYDVVVRGRWDYITDRGNKVSLTKRYHEHVQAGNQLRFKRGLGTVDRYSRFAPSGQPIPTVSPNGRIVGEIIVPVQTKVLQPVTQTAWRPVPTQSKAHTIRTWILEAKRHGLGQDLIIQRAMDTLGMNKQLAKTYVAGNWDKV